MLHLINGLVKGAEETGFLYSRCSFICIMPSPLFIRSSAYLTKWIILPFFDTELVAGEIPVVVHIVQSAKQHRNLNHTY